MFSKSAYLFSVALMCYASFVFYPKWKHTGTEATIAWDVSGYYWYLPSLFIYKDIKTQSFKDSILNKYGPTNTNFQQGMKLTNGNYVMKYSSGMAVMYLPFFAMAHVVAGPLGYPRDGFSEPYQLAIQLGGFLVGILGIWYLRRLLLQFYEDKVVAVVLLLLAAGSNYLNYAAIDVGMSHSWLFTLYVFLLFNTVRYYKTFRLKYAVRIGLLVGLATLTRPTEIISCLIPLLWGMEALSPAALRDRYCLLRDNAGTLLTAGACAALVLCVQLAYWKYVSGHWLVYSYGDQGFSWVHPHVLLYSFNYRSGWLTYSPMLLLALAGLIPLAIKGRNRVAILAFILLNYYIVSAWDIWWYGGRAMVQCYAVLALPMAALVQYAWQRKWLALVIAPVVIVFLYFNIWITYQYHAGGLYDSESMTKEYFWRVAGRWGVPERTKQLRDNKDLYEGQPKDSTLLYQNDFEKDTGVLFTSTAISGVRSLRINKIDTISPVYSFMVKEGSGKWIRASAVFLAKQQEWEAWRMTRFVIRLIDKNNTAPGGIVKEVIARPQRFLNNNEPRVIACDMKLPDVHYDSVAILFRNVKSDQEITIDNLKVWAFNE